MDRSTKNRTVKVGKRGVILNAALLDQQKAWDNLEKIKDLHAIKLKYYQELDEMEPIDPARCKDIAAIITECEFSLQDAWGFPKAVKFHKFWETPRCTCPKMDNGDNWPTGYYITAGDCPLHGG